MDARLPFSVEDATRPDDPNRPETDDANAEPQFKRVLLETRLNNRVIDLRVNQFSVVEFHHTLIFFSQTTTNQAIFRLQSAIGDLFRQFLSGQGFIEIHSPKLQGAATESGASVFKVSYFKGN